MTLLALLLLAPIDPPERDGDPAAAARRVDELLQPLSEEAYTHGRERAAVEGLADLCQTSCDEVLAAAMDPSRAPLHHAALWWALSGPPPRPYRDAPPRTPCDPAVQAQIDAAAQRTLLDPSEAPEARRAAARALLRPVHGPDHKVTGSASGEATLRALLRDSADPSARAAAACALGELGGLSPGQLDAETVKAAGGCTTPWAYGQQETPPGPG